MWVVEIEDVFKLILAILVGGLIGLERQFQDKPAGFRTNILICVGSALFTMFSSKIGTLYGTDPARITAQIVTGIGFLGAGAIIRRGEDVLGLTTAATIWLTASIGMGVGAGYYSISLIGALLALGVLFLFRRIDDLVDQLHHVRTYHVVLSAGDEALENFHQMLNSSKLKIQASKQMKSDDHYFHEITLSGKRSQHEALVEHLVKSPAVKEIKF